MFGILGGDTGLGARYPERQTKWLSRAGFIPVRDGKAQVSGPDEPYGSI